MGGGARQLGLRIISEQEARETLDLPQEMGEALLGVDLAPDRFF
jgi:hypothetical protein